MSENSTAKLSVRSFHTILYCEKWKECISFYRDVLGFSVVFANEIFVEVQLVPGTRLGLMEASRTRWTATHGDSFILSFRVSDIEETHRSLRKRYADLGEIKHHPWGARLFMAKDPEGRRIEFWSDSSCSGGTG